jgi:hypothetical protein
MESLSMSKGLKIVVGVLLAFLSLSFLHVWLNIGFAKMGFTSAETEEASFRVGFIPVT